MRKLNFGAYLILKCKKPIMSLGPRRTYGSSNPKKHYSGWLTISLHYLFLKHMLFMLAYEGLSNTVKAYLIPLFLLCLGSGVAVVSGEGKQPSQVLKDGHHKRSYPLIQPGIWSWVGCLAYNTFHVSVSFLCTLGVGVED